METELKAIIDTQHAPTDLIITYDDWHGLWGGSILTIRGDGSFERQTNVGGAPPTTVIQKQISEHKVVELVCLLVALTAWEQRTPERQPVPDESRAQVTIHVNSNTSRVWEWFNAMPTNNRLIQIKHWMENL